MRWYHSDHVASFIIVINVGGRHVSSGAMPSNLSYLATPNFIDGVLVQYKLVILDTSA